MDFDVPSSTWMPLTPHTYFEFSPTKWLRLKLFPWVSSQATVFTRFDLDGLLWPLTFNLQNLIRSSAGNMVIVYSLSVSSKKPFMRYRGNNIWPDERTEQRDSLKHKVFATVSDDEGKKTQPESKRVKDQKQLQTTGSMHPVTDTDVFQAAEMEYKLLK